MHSAMNVSEMARLSIDDQIAARGFAVVASSGNGASIEASEVYTVGLYAEGMPEIIVSGLGLARGAVLADLAASWMRSNGDRYQLCKLDVEFPGEILPVHFVSVPTGASSARYEEATKRSRGAAEFVRLCVQDVTGKWPWDHSDWLKLSKLESQTSGWNAF